MAKYKKKEKAKAHAHVDPVAKSGCDNCGNTGLEPGVALSVAKECPVCHGSPFGE